MKEFIDKLIEQLKKYQIEYKSGFGSLTDETVFRVMENVIYTVKELAKEQNNGWVSCSERLPEERGWYLAVFQEGDSDFILVPRVADYIGEHTPFTTEEGWLIIDLEDDMNSYYKKLKCLAWCELPAPYTEGEKDCNTCANNTDFDEVDNGCYMCCKGLENNYEPIQTNTEGE